MRNCVLSLGLPHYDLPAIVNRYQRYLESVLEVADEYQEAGDLLARHTTLSATNADLKDHQRKCSELAESIRAELALYVKHKTDEILTLNNVLARAKKELEGCEGDAQVQESRKDASLAVASAKTLEYGQVVLSTDNIFSRCRARSKIGYPAESNPLHQLDVVGNYLSDLTAIARQWRQDQQRKVVRADDGPGTVPAPSMSTGIALNASAAGHALATPSATSMNLGADPGSQRQSISG